MARLHSQPGLLPSLLDRLIDPQSAGTGQQPGYSLSDMYGAVLRDLDDLLNTRRTGDKRAADYEYLSNSIFAYGLPDFLWTNPQVHEEREAMEQGLAEVIRRFEPRLRDIRVAMVNVPDNTDRSVHFRIEASLNVDPAEPVTFETSLEPSTGRCSVKPGAA